MVDPVSMNCRNVVETCNVSGVGRMHYDALITRDLQICCPLSCFVPAGHDNSRTTLSVPQILTQCQGFGRFPCSLLNSD